MGITIVGLGPGDGRYLTRQAWEVLATAEFIFLRTAHHPAVLDLPAAAHQASFDHLYETAGEFEEVYRQITAEVLQMGRKTDLVYAVPGHPFIGESTVTAIVAAAQAEGLSCSVVAGLSFVEPTLVALGIDGLEGLQVFDALEVARLNFPPFNTDVPVLLGQVYSRLLASDLKLALAAVYPEEHEVILVHAAGTVDQSLEHIPLHAIDHSIELAHLSSLFIPPLPYRSSLPALAETVAYLRGPDGCPWDQEQTPQSLRRDFLEETSEVLDALDTNDSDALCEELGDILYHLLMQVVLAAEEGDFTLTDVIAGIDRKLRRRHPHVWGEVEVTGSAEVVRNWEKLKALEKKSTSGAPSLLNNLPSTLPALARAQKIQARVRKVGFDWLKVNDVIAKVEEEIAELKESQESADKIAELGDILFAVVNWARWLGIDAEIALREANLRFERRFRQLEKLVVAQGQELEQLDLATMDRLWQAAKQLLAES